MKRALRSGRWAGVMTVALLLPAPCIEAQTLSGTILDSETGDPVTLAYVGLLAEGRELVVAALASSQGAFTLEAPEEGSYFLYVSRTGYETLLDGLFDLGEGGGLDLRVGLKPAPVELDPLDVTASRDESPLEAAGFYERAVTGRGYFLTRQDIMRTAVERVTDAFRDVPPVGVLSQRPLTGPNVMQSPEIVMRRGGLQCSPTLYIDRNMVASGTIGPVRPDDYVAPMDVEAMEVYARTASTPPQFDAIGNCGVVVIWTRMR